MTRTDHGLIGDEYVIDYEIGGEIHRLKIDHRIIERGRHYLEAEEQRFLESLQVTA